MNNRAQLLCAWCGPAMVAIWVVSFVFLAGFIPPPPPDAPAADTLAMFTEHGGLIRLGLVLTLFASALLVPWSAAVSMQMIRIEGRRPVLALTQMGSGIALSLEFIVPIMVWQAAAYRPGPEKLVVISVLNDMGWLMFVGVISSVVIQALVFGVAILLDTGERPVFPRWSGYFTIWTALLLSPAGLVPLFRSGPFAWNGVFAFWIPLSVYCVWMLCMAKLVIAAIRTDTPAAELVAAGS
ncbi:MAG: hypothetical protein QOC83_3872 [Pseudonocardiales bacterium]|nr:hypothetical protein [Pseudonocardia sp.]MDT7639584.1 hypothetical protein [Pseudonocardiales bacterium]